MEADIPALWHGLEGELTAWFLVLDLVILHYSVTGVCIRWRWIRPPLIVLWDLTENLLEVRSQMLPGTANVLQCLSNSSAPDLLPNSGHSAVLDKDMMALTVPKLAGCVLLSTVIDPFIANFAPIVVSSRMSTISEETAEWLDLLTGPTSLLPEHGDIPTRWKIFDK